MPTVIHSTQTEIEGPTLLDKEALERLDRIFARESGRLGAMRDSVLSKAEQVRLSEERDEYFERYRRDMSEEEIAETLDEIRSRLPRELGYRDEALEITLELKSGKKITASSFEEAGRSTELLNEPATNLEVEYVVNELDVNIAKRWSGGLSLRVRPATSPNAGELYSVLRGWCESTRPSTYMRMWYGARERSFIFVPILIFLALLSIVPTSHHQMKQRAIQFAKEGVHPGQEREALQTLLAIAGDYEPTSYSLFSTKQTMALLFLAIFIVVFIQFAPTFEVGLGVGATRIGRQRAIGKFILISIPVYILALLVGHYWK